MYNRYIFIYKSQLNRLVWGTLTLAPISEQFNQVPDTIPVSFTILGGKVQKHLHTSNFAFLSPKRFRLISPIKNQFVSFRLNNYIETIG